MKNMNSTGTIDPKMNKIDTFNRSVSNRLLQFSSLLVFASCIAPIASIAASADNAIHAAVNRTKPVLLAQASITQAIDASALKSRSGFTQTILPTGQILVHGGIASDQRLSETSAIVDEQSQAVRVLSSTGLLPRSGHTATLLTDGRVVIIGGSGADRNLVTVVEIWDPLTGAVERFDAKLETARFGHIAELLPSSPVRISGGLSTDNKPASSSEIFDPVLKEFFRISPEEEHLWTVPTLGQPGVAASIPAAGAVDAATNRWLSLRFTKHMDAASVGAASVTLFGPDGVVPAKVVVAEAGLLAFVNPEAELLPDSYYTLFLSGVKDAKGAALPFTTIGFKTRAIPGVTGGSPHGSRQAQGGAVGHPSNLDSSSSAVGGGGNAAPQNAQAHDNVSPKPLLRDLQSDDEEAWIPGARQLKGDWRSDRQPHASAKAAKLVAGEGVTALSGQVLRMNGRPLANVSLSIADKTVLTDEAGRFLITAIPAGSATLVIDGAPANRADASYGLFEARIDIVAGKTNDLPFTVWMPKLDTANEITIPSPTTEEIVLTTPRIPGFQVRIPKGVVIRDRAGKIVTKIGITALPTDNTPFPIPEMGFSIYYTVQPGGAFLQSVDGNTAKAARLVYPNYSEALPNTSAKFWLYDPQDRGWFIYGLGKVASDGQSISGAPDVGLYTFTGGGAAFAPFTPPPGPPPCQPGTCCIAGGKPPGDNPDRSPGKWGGNDSPGDPGCPGAGDPVSAGTGSFIHTERDLMVADIVPIDVTRTHKHDNTMDGPFGKGTLNPYEMFLANNGGFTNVTLVLPNHGQVKFTCVPDPATNACSNGIAAAYPPQFVNNTTAGLFYGAKIKFNASAIPGVKGFDMVLLDGSFYKFAPHGGHLYYFKDRFGNTTTLTRQGGGENTPITKITSPSGRFVNFTYITLSIPGFPTPVSYVSQITDNLGRSFNYTYNAATGYLATVTDPLGGIRRYTYDSSNRLVSVTDPNGNIMVTNTYYSATDPAPLQGRVKSQTMADGATYQFAYSVSGTGTTTDPYQIYQTNVTDRRGNVRKIEFINGYVYRSTYPLGKPEQQVTSFNISSATGQSYGLTDALGRTTYVSGGFTATGLPLAVTYLYGTANAATWTYTYDPVFDKVTSVKNPLGKVWSMTYDGRGLPATTTDPLGNITRMTYTVQGQLQSVTDPLGHTTTATYFGPDLIALTDALGRTSKFAYDAAGRMIKATDPLGNVTTAEYDPLNRFKKSINPLGGAVQFTYDNNGNLLSHTDPLNRTTAYTYNNLSLPVSKRDALLQTESALYDGAGKVKQITDRKGQVAGVTYDNAGRVSQIGYGAAPATPSAFQNTLTYTYDAGNRVTQIADSLSGLITRQYDGMNRLVQETTPQGTVNYTYDAAGRRTAMQVAGQSAVNYTWDDANRLTQMSQGASSIAFTYDAAGKRTKTTLANGASMEYTYDNASQLTQIVYKQGATVTGNVTYAYDAAGRRVSQGGTAPFVTTVNLPTPTSATALYDANNRLTRWNGIDFAYDANGNLSRDGQKTYTWDTRNQLQGITGTATGSFSYDAFGRRINKAVNGQQTGYLYDGANFVQELNGTTAASGAKANLLTGGIDETFQRSTTTTTSHYLTNALGSTTALTDASGNATATYSYDPYGNTTKTGSDTNSQTYTGREDDGTGLFYYRARYYMPTCGRFISEDPIGIAGGMNQYAHVGGNPISFTDPFGLSPICAGERVIEETTLRGPDFYTVSFPIPLLSIGIAGLNGVFTVDAFGARYGGFSLGFGTPIGVQLGWLADYTRNPPTADQTRDFLTEWGGSWGFGLGTAVSSEGLANLITTPGASIDYTWQLGKPLLGPRTRRWDGGCR